MEYEPLDLAKFLKKKDKEGENKYHTGSHIKKTSNPIISVYE